MKWSILGLIVLGVVAAVCATFLVASLRADMALRSRGHVAAQQPEVDVLIAAHAMPAMTVLDGRSVQTKRVRKEDAPAGYFADPVRVAGQVLAVPMVEGQVFTPACFVTSGSEKQLAAVLREGMRAVSVSLPDHSGLEGILYPGSVVDVLVSLALSTASSRESDVVSTVLLQRVQVLAIESHTLLSSDGDRKGRLGARAGFRNITLMVNVKQAEMLRLAMEHGALSLALRNPLDTSPVDAGGVLLSQLSPEFAARREEPAAVVDARPAGSEAPHEPEVAAAKAEAIRWEVLILRGDARETCAVPPPSVRAASLEREDTP